MDPVEKILLKINVLKAKVEQDSISPLYLGNILEEIVRLLDGLDIEQLEQLLNSGVIGDDIKTLINQKLDASVFDDLFEKVNVGSEETPQWAIKAKYDFFSTGEVTAFGNGGANGSGGSDGGSVDLLTDWANYSTLIRDSYGLSAGLGYDLRQGLNALQASLANYYTAIQCDARYQPVGNYLTEHQSLANYVDKTTAQEISGAKTFTVGSWILKANEENEIKSVQYGNGSISQGAPSTAAAIRNGIDFRWYNTDWVIGNIRGTAVGTDGFGIGLLNSSGKLDLGLRVTKDKVLAAGFATFNGTSSQFLKADGSVDNNSYALASALSNYLPLTGGSMANTNLVSNLNADMLDGVHASGLLTSFTREGANCNQISLTVGGTTKIGIFSQ